MDDKGGRRVWAALDKSSNKIIALIPFGISELPKKADFAEYRTRARQFLEMLGHVKTGHLEIKDDELVFVERLNHSNRAKNPKAERVPSIYKIERGGHYV